ncbi:MULTISPECIES: AI-2E family transporter [Paracoccus]|uniref:AI-2E family transporter n=1 Tax=Paracoccus marcusii TaxID=59779 RepID=A0ABY7URF2_9RHOB|nr:MULTISPECIES: AI-2E family transporter [Paracoccus]QXI63906.1 Putative transport protein YhhT [Paracoccus marcusii]WDA12188.1 AI-2E family transporter [Paracoccus marcusii]
MDHSNETVLRERLQTGFLGLIAFSLLMFMLVQAKFILISLAIAIILFSLTSDAIHAISTRLRVPNWLATTLALIGIALGLLWVSTTIVAQVNEVVFLAISYAERAQAALPALTERLGPEAQERIITALTNFNITGWIRSLAGQASGLLSGSVLVILFVGFMFAEQVWFPLKIERLANDADHARQIRRIIASIMHRVNRYLVVKTGVSAVTASIVWLIFWTMGLELATAVALLTFVLNFIPSVGSIIATLIAVLLAFVLTGDPTATVIVGVLCAVTQFLIGNIIDPMLLGQTLRLSSFGIILSLAFWGAIWGVPGMFLAVPIMVALMIICAHIPWLRGVAVMLSREGLPDDGDNDVQSDRMAA